MASFLNDEEFAEADIFAVYEKVLSVGHMEMFRPNESQGGKVMKSPIL